MRFPPFARKLLARLPVATAAALAVWFGFAAELCGRAVMQTTEVSTRAFERPRATLLAWDEGVIQVRRTDAPEATESLGFRPAALTGNAVLLLALAWATPLAASRNGLLRLVLGLLVLFVLQVVHLGLALQTVYATGLGDFSRQRYSPWEREIVATGRYFFDVVLTYAMPILIWGLLVALPAWRECERVAAPARVDPPRSPAGRGPRRSR